MKSWTQGLTQSHAQAQPVLKVLNISETIQIPTPKPYIYLCFLWYKAFSNTDREVRSGVARHVTPSSLHKRLNILETVQIPTPKPYIFIFLRITTFNNTSREVSKGVPGIAPNLLLHKLLDISETIQIPTPKPYIFIFLRITTFNYTSREVSKGVPGIAPNLLLHKLLDISETIQIPTLNHIYLWFLWQDPFNSTFWKVSWGMPGNAHSVHFIKGLISGEPTKFQCSISNGWMMNRGVKIEKNYTCPGTSNKFIMYLSKVNFTCPKGQIMHKQLSLALTLLIPIVNFLEIIMKKVWNQI